MRNGGDWMKILQRDFDSNKNDYKKLWDFFIEDYAMTERVTWTLGRLGDWKHGLWHYKKTDPHFLSRNCLLWVNAFDELQGFAIAEEGDALFHLFVKPYMKHLYSEMLDFVESNWMDREGMVKTEISEDYNMLILELESRGYKRNIASQTRSYDINEFEQNLTLPDGYSIVNGLENHNDESKLLLFHSGFQNKDSYEEWDMITLKYNRESPIYDPVFDFFVITDEGQHVSTCVCFIDHKNGYAEIEKVCTHKDFRKKGLSSTLIQYAIMELKKIGIRKAYISGYSNEAQKTYAKVGDKNMIQNYFFEKKK